MEKWKQGKRFKFIPEIRELVEIKYTPEKLNPNELNWLTNENLKVAHVLADCIEKYRQALKETWDKDTIKHGFLGTDTSHYEDKKWEELVLCSNKVIDCTEKNIKYSDVFIWNLILTELHPEEPYKALMQHSYNQKVEKIKKSQQAKKARKKGLEVDPVQDAKKIVEEMWLEWRQDHELSYPDNNHFAEEMIRINVNLTSEGTIKAWCTQWAKKYGIKIKRGRKPKT